MTGAYNFRISDQILYKHTQTGWATLVTAACVFPIVAIATQAGMAGMGALTLLSLTVVGLIAAMFGWMTVTLTSDRFSWRFGIGLIGKSVSVADIRGTRSVRNPWYYGWGVRLTPKGWLYNVSGLSAIEIELANGRHLLIGTDEPDVLQAELQKVVREAPGAFARSHRPAARTAFILANVVGVPLALAVIFYVHMKPPRVGISDGTLSVGSGFYHDDIDLRARPELSLQDSIPRILRRTNGFALGGTLRGHFTLDVTGPADLFITRNPPYIIIRTADKFVVVNFAREDRTRALYDELRHEVSSR